MTTTVLFVDDDPLVLLAMTRMLRSRYKVIDARSMRQALRLLQTASTDPLVIVSDYRLTEGMTGRDLIEAVRAKLGRAVPAIIFSAGITATAMLPPNCEVRKPQRGPELFAVIDRLVAAGENP